MTKLHEIPKENPFKVPEGYFDEVNKKIISATSGSSRKTHHVPLRTYLLAAASVALFILLSYAATRLLTPRRDMLLESETVMEDYLSPYIYELDIYSLEENAASIAVPEQETETNKSEIIDYLILNNIQINEIYEFL